MEAVAESSEGKRKVFSEKRKGGSRQSDRTLGYVPIYIEEIER